MMLQDFNSLIVAQAYEVKGQRMISPDMMTAFLARAGIFRAIQSEDSEAAAALRAALQFGSEFNLIEDHPLSVESLLGGLAAATPEFVKSLKDYANPISRPFKDSTPEDFEASKLIGLSSSSRTKYTGIEADFIVNVGLEAIEVKVDFETTTIKDLTLKLSLAEKEQGELDFYPLDYSPEFKIPKGTLKRKVTIPRKLKGRHIQITGEVDIKGASFSLDVGGR